MSIFVDSGAFYALADENDKHHKRAKAYYSSNYVTNPFITSEYVVVESWNLIHHKMGQAAAKNFWKTIRTNIFPLHRITALDLERAWEISNKYRDQDLSLVDCTSFALMERLGLAEAFAFDIHFSLFRPKTGTPFIIHPH